MAMKICLRVYGLINDISFQRSKCCAEELFVREKSFFATPEIQGMLEFEWDLFIEAKKKELRGESWIFNGKAIIFQNNTLIGNPEDFLQWAEDHFSYQDFRPLALMETLTEEAYKSYLNSRNTEFVYMDMMINKEPAGRLLIELFVDKVPKTCENFKVLCTGEKGMTPDDEYKLTYENTLFHRIVRNGWIQGGDIYMGRGNGGESIHGKVFEDENFSVKHTRRGIVGMANNGRHTNGSQFYISLQPTSWMDTKYVAFGQVIEGTDTLKKMEELETMNERPTTEIRVEKCGIITFEF